MYLPKAPLVSLLLSFLFLGCCQAVLESNASTPVSGSSTGDGYHYCSVGKGLPVLYSCNQVFEGAANGSTVSLHGLSTPEEYIILLKNTTANGTADEICDNVRFTSCFLCRCIGIIMAWFRSRSAAVGCLDRVLQQVM
jgi:hypothetical protein